MDVDTVLRNGSEEQLLGIWTSHQRVAWTTPQGAPEAAEVIHRQVSDAGNVEQRQVSALNALRANTELVDLLTGRRWMVIQDAREAGATWEQIGQALGMSRHAARNWYKRKIRAQERYVEHRHDVRRGQDAVGQAND